MIVIDDARPVGSTWNEEYELFNSFLKKFKTKYMYTTLHSRMKGVATIDK